MNPEKDFSCPSNRSPPSLLFFPRVPSPAHPEVMSALRDAALEAGSVEGEEFDIRFNVDALSPGVTHADPPVRHTAFFIWTKTLPRDSMPHVTL